MDDFRGLFRKLWRLLASRGPVADDIDDLMQEAFLRLQLYCKENTVRNSEAFLVRTALNLVAERARRSHPGRTTSDEAELLALVDPTPSPDEVYASQQHLQRMSAGLERLNPRSCEAFLMHRIEGMSYVQIAEQLDISVSMVEKHIARASFFLRDWMAKWQGASNE